MKFPKGFMFVGGRIVKTGIAVFVTALICHLLNWPAMFAVITAIVTIEPTASDSIRKAFVRFPATAIGAANAIFFTFLFKDSAFTYAFVALSTIIVCHKLKLHHGILVATLTGVAMITTIHDQYVSSFFIRLAATSTGLIVSSLVNVFVMPPKYSAPISDGVSKLFNEAGRILERRGSELLRVKAVDKELMPEFQVLLKDLEKIKNLCLYQKNEWKFHRVSREEIRTYRYEYKKLTVLRRMVHHIGILIYLPSNHVQFSQHKRDILLDTIKLITIIFNEESFSIEEAVQKHRREMSEWLHDVSVQNENELTPGISYSLSSEMVLIYEILSIQELAITLCQLYSRHHHHSSA